MAARRKPIHQRALRAAAAVTLSVAPACAGNKVKETKPAAEPAKAAVVAPTKPVAAPAKPTAAPAKIEAAAAQGDNKPPVRAKWPNCRGSKRGINGNCCKRAAHWCEEQNPGKPQLASTCAMQVPGCTPWGPPAPPKFVVKTMPRFKLFRVAAVA